MLGYFKRFKIDAEMLILSKRSESFGIFNFLDFSGEMINGMFRCS